MHLEKTTADATVKLELDSFTAQKDFSSIIAHDILNSINDIANNSVTFDLCITSLPSDIGSRMSKKSIITNKDHT